MDLQGQASDRLIRPLRNLRRDDLVKRRPSRDIGWWYWLATVPLVAGAALGCRWSLAIAITLTLVQAIHFTLLVKAVTGFAVQVRLAYLGLLMLGSIPAMHWVHWVQVFGTSAMVVFGYCLLARALSLLTWNRSERLTASLVAETFLSLHPKRQAACGAVVGSQCTPAVA